MNTLTVCPAGAQVLPADRRFTNAWMNAGYRGAIPAPDTIVNVLDFGALGNGSSNDAPAVQAAIDSRAGTGGVVYFPPGTYYMQANISVGNGVVLRGHRPATTTLRFDTAGHAIDLVGGRSGGYQAIVSGYNRHSSVIEVANGSAFQPGDFAETQQDLDPAWTGVTWDNCGQMVRIAAVAGNTLTLERPLRLQYTAGLNPRIVKVVPRTNAGVENLKVERLKVGTDPERYNVYTIRMFLAANCWVRGVEAYNGFGGHVALVYSTQSEVTGCHIHHAHFYGGGGSGYGTRMEYKTGECKVENNILHDLRHSMLVQAFVNGNVHGYNYSFNANASDGWGQDTSDVTLHGNYPYANLYEGNIVQHIWIDSTHGANGPHNLFFRNRAARNGFNMTDSIGHQQSVMGNELFRGGILVQLGIGNGYKFLGSDHFTYGNNTVASGLQPANTGDLTDYSYYLGPNPTQPPPTPAWWKIADAIPTIGVPKALGTAKNIPAYARHQAGGVKTVGPPSLFRQPTNRVVNQGAPVAFSVGAVGTPSASYQWYRNGAELTGKTDATLTLSSAQPADAGTYHVVVTDPDGSVRSADASLTVNLVDVTLVTAGSPARHGAPTPFGYGTNKVALGTVVTNAVAATVPAGTGARECCAGWTGTGSIPASGGSNRVVAAVAADSVLTWNWRREYYLDVSHTGSGTVNIASAWLPSGTNVTLRATPRDYYRFLGWSGDVAPAQAGDRTIILAMDAARSVLAAFDTNRLPRGTVLELR